MSTLLTVILPFFALILCGWIGARRNLVSAAGITGLNGFVYWFALPAMLFLGLYSQPIDALFQPRYVLAYALVGVVPFLAILTLARGSLAELSMQALASVYSNTGYMGIPLLVALLGREATGPAVLIVVADLVVSVPATIALMEVTRGDAGSPLAALRQVARGFIGSPLLWSIVLGFAASAVQLRLPVAVDSFLHLIGSGAGPVALFAIGGSLAGRSLNAGLPRAVSITIIKLAVHPLMMAACFMALFHFGPVATKAAILAAALPTAGTVFVLAQQYATPTPWISSAILLSTLAGVVTFSASVWMLGV
ncbi:AEC family transporter [Radicibacter daui]|uniref:AEC family transporter n=1 Tax=Radicibacter daui TaxID=3064829 RepID=UPI004046A814